MKKFILSFAAICVMVLTAVSFASCSDDDDAASTITVKPAFAITVNSTATAQDQAIATAMQTAINAQVAEVLNATTVDLDATSDGPTTTAISELQMEIMQDSGIQTLISQMKNNSTILHLNFEVKNAKNESTVYYSNVIF